MTYEPACRGSVPPCPAAPYGKPFKYRETYVPPYTAEDLTKTMPLCKLLDIALYNNPQTRASWNGARAAAFNYRASLSSYWPTISLDGELLAQESNGLSSSSSQGGSVNINSGAGAAAASATSTTLPVFSNVSVFNEITASYLLFDYGGRDAQANYAYNLLQAANWQHNLVIQEVMLAVLNSYTNYIGNKALVVAYEQNLKDAEVLLASAKSMRNAGLATLTDVLSAQSFVEQTKLNLEQAKGAEKTAFGALLIDLGLPPCTCLDVQDLPDELPVIQIDENICTLIEIAKRKRPDIAASIALANAQGDLLTASFSASMPIVTVNANASTLRRVYPKSPSTFNNNIGLFWNVPLFNGFFYVNQQKQIRAQIQQALANLDVTVSQVDLGIVTNYYAYTTAAAALAPSEALLVFSERTYRGFLAQYKVGTASIIDVVTSLTTLSNARVQKINARTQWVLSLANLAFSVGILEDTSGEWMKAPPEELYKIEYKDNK